MPDNDDRNPFSPSAPAPGGDGRHAPAPLRAVARRSRSCSWPCSCSTASSRTPRPIPSRTASSSTAVEEGRIDHRDDREDLGLGHHRRPDDRRRPQGVLHQAVAQRHDRHRSSPNFLDDNGVTYEFDAAERLPVADPQHPAVRADHDRHLLVRVPADGRRRLGRPQHGQEQGQDLRPQGDEDDLRRRRRRRRGQGRAPRGRRLPQRTRRSTSASAAASPRASCCSALPAAARRCSPAPSPARPTCRSSSCRGSEFVEMFVGLGAARVRELFQQAEGEGARASSSSTRSTRSARAAPAPWAAGLRRPRRARADAQPAAGRDGRLRRVQGRHHHGRHEPSRCARSGARPPGPLRPPGRGRPPRPQGPRGDPRVHARGVALDPDVDLQHDRRAHPGFTGADLANIVNEAALLAARREKNAVDDGRARGGDRPRVDRGSSASPG